MDYPGNAFLSFLDLNSAIYLAVNGTVTSLHITSQLHPKYLKLCSEANYVFMELERHVGEEVNNDIIIILGLSIPLSGINRNLFQKDVRFN